MNEQILFRYGYTDGTNWIFQQFDITQIENGDPYEVISDNPLLKNYKLTTRDRWTGLTDKNGVKVFEGDEIQSPRGVVYVVRWNDDESRWSMYYDDILPYDIHISFLKVIGNIHEKK